MMYYWLSDFQSEIPSTSYIYIYMYIGDRFICFIRFFYSASMSLFEKIILETTFQKVPLKIQNALSIAKLLQGVTMDE